MMNKLLLYWHTIKYLKVRQICYRIYYMLRRKVRRVIRHRYSLSIKAEGGKLKLLTCITNQNSYDDGTFEFLNQSKSFNDDIDWNYSAFGKLWTYNLNYFDWLNQETVDEESANYSIDDFIDNIGFVKDGLEPYPISLRGINWIKYFSHCRIVNEKYDAALFAQYRILADNIEYHLMGNHLLENGFSLLFGAYYFQHDELYHLAYNILTTELDEQLLADGAHFELSTMYHQIILNRLLDAVNLVKHNIWHQQELLALLEQKASTMLAWLNNMTFSNGDIPLLNDSAYDISPTTEQLNNYADSLGLTGETGQLTESGYRMLKNKNFELCCDIGQIGPSYIPGHAHADSLSFVLYTAGKPLIVDPGISTYEKNERRYVERSTRGHNTVTVSEHNSSHVWGGFRVAERAEIIALEETGDSIIAAHNGYRKKFGIIHQRKFSIAEDKVIIIDNIQGKKVESGQAFLHFVAGINIDLKDGEVLCDTVKISFIGAIKVELQEYAMAEGFNKLTTASCICISFEDELVTKIKRI